MNKKVLIGGLAGGVLFFFVGWFVWGMLLAGYYEANMNHCMMLPMEEMRWGALIAFNIIWGFFLALVLFWAGANDFMEGLVKGAILGLLVSLAIDLSFYSMTSMYTGGLTALGVDVLVNTVVSAAIGGCVALVMGKVSA